MFTSATLEPPPTRRRRTPARLVAGRSATQRDSRLRKLWNEHRITLGVYAASRVLFAVIALLDTLRGWSEYGWGTLGSELSNWDGVWYVRLAEHGYSTFPYEHVQTTLGFLPLYAVVMWLFSHVLWGSMIVAGLFISLIGGGIATVLVGRLAKEWWGEAASRRAVLFFCLFPGSIVFSMDYSEGIMIPLAVGSLLALQHRRWVLAGLLAGCATAVTPVALAIIPACAVAAIGEFRRLGLGDRRAWRSLWAPALSPLGIGGFAIFLWAWTGTPLASYNAQHIAWSEESTPLAIFDQIGHMFGQLFALHGINLNYENGVLGAVFLIWAISMIRSTQPRISAAAATWVVWIAILTLTSANTPPNPRMLICAFPALMVVAYRLRGMAYRRLIIASTVLLVITAPLTFVASSLRP